MLVAFFAIFLCSESQAQFFTVTKRDNTWWLLDPSGNRFFSTGVNVVDIGPAPAEFDSSNPSYCGLCFYPSADQWAKDTIKRLNSWGFNTIGSYSGEHIIKNSSQPYTIALWLGIGVPYVDIQADDKRRKIRERVHSLTKYRNDPRLIGYFIDNEIGWWDETIFEYLAKKPWENRLKRVLWEMLDEEYHGQLGSFQEDFVVKPQPKKFDDIKKKLTSIKPRNGRRPLIIDRFVEYIANEYYRTITAEIRKVDPNHLILCDRYADYYSQSVVKVAGRYCDVISVNYNPLVSNGWISPYFFETLHELSGRPILVSEFYFAAMENRSGNRNIKGPFIVVKTQNERASSASKVAEQLARFPHVIGYHWFQFADEPPRGRRLDGEDFNFGLVDIHNVPYEELVSSLSEVNSNSLQLHQAGPKDKGLRESEDGWQVPHLQGTRNINGQIQEWNLPLAWVSGARAKEPFSRFGDFYLSWVPEGLLMSVIYENSYMSKRQSQTLLNQERFYLTIGQRDQGLFRIVLHAPPLTPDIMKNAKIVSRKLIPVDVQHTLRTISSDQIKTIQGIQRSRGSFDNIVEVLIPASLLGSGELRSGDTLRFGATLTLRGNAKEIFWPISISENFGSLNELAPLQLVE